MSASEMEVIGASQLGDAEPRGMEFIGASQPHVIMEVDGASQPDVAEPCASSSSALQTTSAPLNDAPQLADANELPASYRDGSNSVFKTNTSASQPSVSSHCASILKAAIPLRLLYSEQAVCTWRYLHMLCVQ